MASSWRGRAPSELRGSDGSPGPSGDDREALERFMQDAASSFAASTMSETTGGSGSGSGGADEEEGSSPTTLEPSTGRGSGPSPGAARPSFVDRLYKWHQRKEEKLERARREETRRTSSLEVRECTFHPKITGGNGAPPPLPVPASARSLPWSSKRGGSPASAAAVAAAASVSPATSSPSGAGAVVDRLHDWQEKRDAKVRSLIDEAVEASERECTFRPAISAKSKNHPGKLSALLRAIDDHEVAYANSVAESGAESVVSVAERQQLALEDFMVRAERAELIRRQRADVPCADGSKWTGRTTRPRTPKLSFATGNYRVQRETGSPSPPPRPLPPPLPSLDSQSEVSADQSGAGGGNGSPRDADIFATMVPVPDGWDQHQRLQASADRVTRQAMAADQRITMPWSPPPPPPLTSHGSGAGRRAGGSLASLTDPSEPFDVEDEAMMMGTGHAFDEQEREQHQSSFENGLPSANFMDESVSGAASVAAAVVAPQRGSRSPPVGSGRMLIGQAHCLYVNDVRAAVGEVIMHDTQTQHTRARSPAQRSAELTWRVVDRHVARLAHAAIADRVSTTPAPPVSLLANGTPVAVVPTPPGLSGSVPVSSSATSASSSSSSSSHQQQPIPSSPSLAATYIISPRAAGRWAVAPPAETLAQGPAVPPSQIDAAAGVAAFARLTATRTAVLRSQPATLSSSSSSSSSVVVGSTMPEGRLIVSAPAPTAVMNPALMPTAASPSSPTTSAGGSLLPAEASVDDLRRQLQSLRAEVAHEAERQRLLTQAMAARESPPDAIPEPSSLSSTSSPSLHKAVTRIELTKRAMSERLHTSLQRSMAAHIERQARIRDTTHVA